ncbi:MAG: hypothetical protein R3B70_19260, partial [Polyangiaceae bacterium]
MATRKTAEKPADKPTKPAAKAADKPTKPAADKPAKPAAKAADKPAPEAGKPRPVKGEGTKESPWQLQTPSLTGDLEIYR